VFEKGENGGGSERLTNRKISRYLPSIIRGAQTGRLGEESQTKPYQKGLEAKLV
jgi:hypothetical protein